MVNEIDGLKDRSPPLAEILNKVAPTGIGVIASAGDSHASTVMVRDEPETEAFLRSLADRGDGEFVDGNERTMRGAIFLAVLG